MLLNESDFPARNGLLQFFPEGRTGGYWGEVPPPALPHEKPGLYILNMAMVQSVTRNRRCLVPRPHNLDHKCGIGFSSVFDMTRYFGNVFANFSYGIAVLSTSSKSPT